MEHLQLSNKIEKKSYVNQVFQDIDYSELDVITSFLRCDFRGTKFKNIQFLKNDFDRSDFIDSVFINVTFESVNFGTCEINNCMFINCSFKMNRYTSTNVINCNFDNCFIEEDSMKLTISNSKFTNSSFIESSFEESSFEDIQFSECKLLNCDFATMHAEYLFFNDCVIENTYFGRDYWATYFMRNSTANNIMLKYRGNVVNLEYFKNSINTYLENLMALKRYCEVLNLVLLSKTDTKLIKKYVRTIFDELPTLQVHVRKKQIKWILEMIDFYMCSDILRLVDSIWVIDFLSKYDWSRLPFEESIVHRSKLFMINEKMSNFSNYRLLPECDLQETSIAKFYFKTDDRDDALQILNDIFTNSNLVSGLKPGIFNFKIINEEKGSWIITILTSMATILIVTKTLRTVLKTGMELKINYVVHNQVVKYLNQANVQSADDLQILINFARQEELKVDNLLATGLRDIMKLKEIEIGVDEPV